MSMVDYNGESRLIAGRLRYATPPEPGTLLGPNMLREDLVVLGQDGPDTLLGYATTEDRAKAMRRAVIGGQPQSLREFRMTVG